MEHKHEPQRLSNGLTLYVCECGARKQKSKIVNGVKTEVWHVETESEKATRERAIEMLETEGYGYGTDRADPLDSHDPRNQD
jgi:hypothetical protein